MTPTARIITQVAWVIRFAKLAFDANLSAPRPKRMKRAMRPAMAGRAPMSPPVPRKLARSDE